MRAAACNRLCKTEWSVSVYNIVYKVNDYDVEEQCDDEYTFDVPQDVTVCEERSERGHKLTNTLLESSLQYF